MADFPDYREGQAHFNTLAIWRPDLSAQIVGTPVDPYYLDERIDGFLQWLDCRWEA